MIWTALRRIWLPLVVAALAGCVAPVAPAPSDIDSTVKAEEEDTSHRELRIGLEATPGAANGVPNFETFCNSMPRSLNIPQEIDETADEVELGCAFGNECFRAATDSEVKNVRGGGALVSNKRTSDVTWTLPVADEGMYSIQVWIPGLLQDLTTKANYTITHATGEDEVTIPHTVLYEAAEVRDGVISEQDIAPEDRVAMDRSDEGRWVELGTFRFVEGDAYVELEAPGSEEFVVDAIRLVKMPDPNLTNAAWLSWFSANEYSHMANVGPALEALGFGAEGEGERYRQCSEDLWAAREWPNFPIESASFDWSMLEERHCMRDWAEARFPMGTDMPTSLAAMTAQFEQHLIQDVDPEATMQFFSGGEFESGGETFKAASTQAVFARHRTRPMAIIAFRGTELRADQKWADLAADGKFWRWALDEAPFSGNWGTAHSGFVEAYLAVEEDLLAKIRTVPADHRIYITGHSLGAALATLMAARIMADNYNGSSQTWLSGLYTFGSPRVGDRVFRSAFHSRASEQGVALLRVRNNSDLITRIPPGLGLRIPFTQRYLLDYMHVGGQLYIDDEGRLELAPAEVNTSLLSGMGDHDITKYFQHMMNGAGTEGLEHFDRCPEEWVETLDELEP